MPKRTASRSKRGNIRNIRNIGRTTPVKPPAETLSEETPPRRKVMIAGVAGALLLFFATYLLRFDRVVGMFGDDAWYALLAKALATGQGYALINSPSAGIMPIYPPAFPWLLSLVYRLSPQFPQNLWLLKSVSIAAMLGIGVVTYIYVKSERKLSPHLALGIAAATALNPAFVFLATSSVMSECVFTLGLLLTVLVIERGVRAEGGRAYWHIAIGGALASFTFLTRSLGLGLILAVVTYLLKERLIRAAAIFVVVVVLLAGSWTLYAWKQAPTPEQRNEQNSYIVQSYTSQFAKDDPRAAIKQPSFLGDLLRRSLNNGARMLEYNIGALVAYPLYRAAEPLAAKNREYWSALLSLLLSLIVGAGFVAALRERVTLAELGALFSVMVVAAWTFASFRFVLPLLPFGILYFILGLRAICRLLQRLFGAPRARAQRAVLLSVVALTVAFNTYANVAYGLSLRAPATGQPAWRRAFEDNVALIQWIGEHIPKEDALTCQNPALVHLYTGHKTVGTVDPAGHWELWKRLGVRYAVLTSIRPLKEPSAAQKRYRLLYTTDNMKLRVLDFGEAASRLPWIDDP